MAAAGGAGAAAIPVYMLIGHSGTTGDFIPVPDKCMQVTFAKCGDVSLVDVDSPANRFTYVFQNPIYTSILLDPIKNKIHIEHEIKTEIGINYPHAAKESKANYDDVLFYPQLTNIFEAGTVIPGDPVIYNVPKLAIYPSGLYRAGSANLAPRLLDISVITDVDEMRNILMWMYEKSIYPTYFQVSTYFGQLVINDRIAGVAPNFNKILESIGFEFQIKQSKLFTLFPGIYYLFSCRSPIVDEPEKLAAVKLRSQVSRSGENIVNFNRLPGGIGSSFKGHIGQKFRLPWGINRMQYPHEPTVKPTLLYVNATGRQIVRIDPIHPGGGVGINENEFNNIAVGAAAGAGGVVGGAGGVVGGARRRSRTKRRSKGSRKNKYTRK